VSMISGMSSSRKRSKSFIPLNIDFDDSDKENGTPNVAPIRNKKLFDSRERMSEARKRRYSTITDFVSSNTGIADRTRGSATIQVTPTLPIPERVNHILSEDAIALAVRVILKLTAEKEAGHVVGTSGVIERANDYLGIGETKLKELRKTYIALRGRVLPPSYIQREPREMRGRISNDWFGRIREEISRIRLTVGKPVEIPDILKWFRCNKISGALRYNWTSPPIDDPTIPSRVATD
jgi:hypothetical protein